MRQFSVLGDMIFISGSSIHVTLTVIKISVNDVMDGHISLLLSISFQIELLELHLVLVPLSLSPLLLLRVEQSKDGIFTTHEVWMICVDVRSLHDNQILDHLVGWLQELNQHLHHFLVDDLPKLLISVKFREIDLNCDPSELFEYHLDTLETW